VSDKAGAVDPAFENAEGVRAQQAGDPVRAARHFERAAEADPGAIQLWLNLAAARRQLGDNAGEEQALSRALAIDQRNFMANLRLGELHERRAETAKAAHHYRAVLALAAMMPERPAGLEPVLAHARDFVGTQSAAFAGVIEGALEPTRSPLASAERRRFDACLDAVLGRRRIFANQPEGLHFPFLPADEFFERRHFPWLETLEAATPAIRAELEGLMAEGLPGLEPYVAMPPGTPANKWSPLDHRVDWGALFLWRHGKPQEAALARCPETARLLDALPLARIPGRGPTAFFSILKPRTRLPAHTGVTNIRAIVHLPLIVPEGCGFRVGGETRAWVPGEAFAFDDTIEHEAWNDSDEPRAILILDTWNPHLTEAERELLCRFFEAADASGHDPGAAAAVG
jgi:aspartyl/asparaginyl beta-hydroxylase (cupin superfamily)